MSTELNLGLSIAPGPDGRDAAHALLFHASAAPQDATKMDAIASLAGMADVTAGQLPTVAGHVDLASNTIAFNGSVLPIVHTGQEWHHLARARRGVIVTLSAQPVAWGDPAALDAMYEQALVPPTPGRLWVGLLPVQP